MSEAKWYPTANILNDEKVLITSGGESGPIADGELVLWDVTGKTILASLKGHKGTVRSIALSPDGKTLATAGSFDFEERVKLWDL